MKTQAKFGILHIIYILTTHHVLEEFEIASIGPHEIHIFENKIMDGTLSGEKKPFPSSFIHAYSSSYYTCINDSMYMGLKIDIVFQS